MLYLFALIGCFTPAADPLSVDRIAYQTDYTERTDLVLQPFHYQGLSCPDGNPATFYAVYPETIDGPAPIVIVFHAGAFDYVETRADGTIPAWDSDEAVFYSGDNRFSSDWAADKVFETLGLLDEVIDPTETNLGILPGALADAGTFALYPANCWGDLWHNETGPRNNNWEADGGVHRDGRYLAWVMTSIANPDPDVATTMKTELGLDDLPISLDASGVYIVGLGEGARAAAELRVRDLIQDVPNQDAAVIKGMVVDSPIDNLSRLVNNDETFQDINDGIARIYPDHTDDDGDEKIEGDVIDSTGYRDDVVETIQAYSLWNALVKGGVNYPLGYWYSSLDPEVPVESIRDVLEQMSLPENVPYCTVTDYADTQHTILNRDEDAARAAVALLLSQ